MSLRFRNSRADLTLAMMLRTVDVGQDIERNQQDSTFAEDAGEIIYVFDENIFEVFVLPAERCHMVNSFYSQRWKKINENIGLSFESQVAMIASEYLLSGKLPGAKRDYIYMTRWHREELVRRIGEIAADLSEVFKNNPDRGTDELRAKIEALRLFQTEDKTISSLRSEDPTLANDMIELSAQEGIARKRDVLRRFQLARTAAKILATSEVNEPFYQLARIFSSELHSRIRTFHLDFVANPPDLKRMKAEAELWFQRLKIEQRRTRTRQAGRARSRPDGALWSDARSLALVRWAATERAYQNQKIVLVTGDDLLFNTYRRWYANPPADDLTYYEPFVLRRVSQFSPIYNLSSSSNDISGVDYTADQAHDTRRIFALIRNAVELIVLPFNLSFYKRPKRPKLANIPYDVVFRGREYFVSKLFDRKSLRDDTAINFFVRAILDGNWFVKIKKAIAKVVTDLRKAERFAIGSSLLYITKRMNDELRSLADDISEKGKFEAGIALKQHLDGIINRVVEDSVSAWLPLAEEFVGDLPLSGAPQIRRVPLTIWYPAGNGKDLTHNIEEWLEDPKKVDWSALFQRNSGTHHTIFAVTATLGLFHDDWFNANHFAELALRSYERSRKSNSDRSKRLEIELGFLVALTKRFCLGDIGRPSAHSEGRKAESRIELTSSVFEAAYRILNGLLKTTEDDSPYQTEEMLPYLMRLYSERGALQLFYAASFISSQGRVRKSLQKDTQLAKALELVDGAKSDLYRCLDLERRAKGHRYFYLIERLQRQYVPIIAATEVVRYLVTPSVDYHFDMALSEHVSRVQEYLRANGPRSFTLVRAEMLAFFVLAGKQESTTLARLRDVLNENAEQALPLDRWVLAALAKRFLPMISAK